MLLAVAAMFLVGGVLMWRGDADDEPNAVRPASTAWAVFVASTAVILVAEFGDFTQLATIGVVATYGYPVAAAVGSTVGHVLVAGIAVLAGGWLQRHVPMRVIQHVGGALFIVFGVITLAAGLW